MSKRRNPAIGNPKGGIWYYVYLKPCWLRLPLFDERAQHMLWWPEHLVGMLVEYYNLEAADARALRPLYAAMPRGRITSKSYRPKDGVYLAHGGDFPRKLGSEASQIREVISEFGLQTIYEAGNVEVIEHEHEMMVKDHQKRIQKIIGKVPY